MTVRNFSQLCEMLDSSRVKFKMSIATYKYLFKIGLSIDVSDQNIVNKYDGISIEFDDTSFKEIEFVPTFAPRIGDGFSIHLD